MSPHNAPYQREVNELSLLFEISRTLERSMDLRDVVGPGVGAYLQSYGHDARHHHPAQP